jgi:hypothetical protein
VCDRDIESATLRESLKAGEREKKETTTTKTKK